MNKKFSLTFPEGYPDQLTLEKDWSGQQLKHCDSNEKDEDISSTVNVNN